MGSPQQGAMHPTLEYGCVVLGLAVGYQTGGYLGTGLVLSSVLALINLYSQGGWCSSKARLDGKTVVITGCNTGIGKITAMDLSKRGAKVVMLCRDTAKANLAAQEIKAETKGDVTVERMDLSSLNSVRDCVERLNKSLKKIDILINNAGVMMCPLSRTEEGFEMQIGTNHFGHFYLTNLLPASHKKSRTWSEDRQCQLSRSQKGKYLLGRHQLGEECLRPSEGVRSVQAGQHPVHAGARCQTGRLRSECVFPPPGSYRDRARTTH